ncbi:WD repeat protein [Quillaja saponaria]|uniref:WD repeat protein n=1 Tax=Quillaja saponaria TaxID=32244 RepID=A0AAD7PWC1_QUISA|nr:WD repeat protein [Quillaja saponaria]
MEEKSNGIGEIEELGTNSDGSPPNPKTVRTMVPEVEIRLYRQGKGPIDVFKSCLGGWDQDQLEVRNILDKYGFKSVFAFGLESGRGVPIRFNPRNGRSLLNYKDGSVVYIDGEPKDSLVKPVTKILLGVAVITLLITLVTREPPEWIRNLNVAGINFPPWILACVVIVFTRMRKRTKDFLKNRGW